MPSTELAVPLLGMMVLTSVVWLWMFVKRFAYISANNIAPDDLKTPEQISANIPAALAGPANNLKNLFELPVIFYVLCLYLMLSNTVDNTQVICAWLFIAFRTLHSVVHCSYNNVNHRFLMYLVSSVALWVMVVRAFLAAI